jgi:hypothetical protein
MRVTTFTLSIAAVLIALVNTKQVLAQGPVTVTSTVTTTSATEAPTTIISGADDLRAGRGVAEMIGVGVAAAIGYAYAF